MGFCHLVNLQQKLILNLDLTIAQTLNCVCGSSGSSEPRKDFISRTIIIFGKIIDPNLVNRMTMSLVPVLDSACYRVIRILCVNLCYSYFLKVAFLL